MRLFIRIAILVSAFFSAVPLHATNDVKEFIIQEKGGTSYNLKLSYDEAGVPQYFFRDIFTPVCLDDVCKPVRINLYWDLLGNYLKFEVPINEPLTKLNHQKFAPEDYGKLQQILANKNSLLKDFKMEELVDPASQNLSDSVDAVTGATKKTIKNEIIDGALYTCYTLWHLANGDVVKEIEKITSKNMNEQLLHQFLKSKNYNYRYWAMDQVIDTAGIIKPTFSSAVMSIMRGKNIFTARYALKKMNVDSFSDSDMQEWLWQTYLNAPYMLQVDLLKKMAGITFDEGTIFQITKHSAYVNREEFQYIMKILSMQPKLSDPVLAVLLTHLSSENTDKAVLACQLLKELPYLNATQKEKLTNYEQNK